MQLLISLIRSQVRWILIRLPIDAQKDTISDGGLLEMLEVLIGEAQLIAHVVAHYLLAQITRGSCNFCTLWSLAYVFIIFVNPFGTCRMT